MELREYVDLWWSTINDFTSLLEELPAEAWSAATDLPGWDVQDVAAHVAHLEALLAGGRHDDTVEVGEPDHVRNPMGTFTEQGVRARADRDPDDLINEIRESATRRRTILLEDLPTDPDAPAPGLFGALGWNNRTLFRNRPLDVWMHEQDVRRAVGRPGNLDGPGARHCAGYLSESLGYVIAKKLGAPAGTTVRVDVEGLDPVVAKVGEDGRGATVPAEAASPDATLRCDMETFTMLAGGRGADPDRVTLEGDTELAARVRDQLAVTP